LPRLVRFTLSLLAVLSLTAAGLTAASAQESGATYMKINKAHGARPGKGVSNLLYHGGPIESAAAVYIVWWGPQWSTGFSSNGFSSGQAQTYVRSFFNNVGGTAWAKTTDQYCSNVPNGTTNCGAAPVHPTNPAGQLKAAVLDTTAVPTSPTQAQIAAEAVKLSGLVNGGVVDQNADYMVFTPTGHSQNGFGTQWCAYHSSSGTVSYSYMPYQPDAGAACGMNFVNSSNGANGSGYFDGFSIVGGHEYAETITDPYPNSGWLDGRGAEIGDKCAWLSSGTGAATNLTFGGQLYAVQSLWSNAAAGCVPSS
jgi:hypothetical protein